MVTGILTNMSRLFIYFSGTAFLFSAAFFIVDLVVVHAFAFGTSLVAIVGSITLFLVARKIAEEFPLAEKYYAADRILSAVISTAFIVVANHYWVSFSNDVSTLVAFSFGWAASGVLLAVLIRAIARATFWNKRYNKATGSTGRYAWWEAFQLYALPLATIITIGVMLLGVTIMAILIPPMAMLSGIFFSVQKMGYRDVEPAGKAIADE